LEKSRHSKGTTRTPLAWAAPVFCFLLTGSLLWADDAVAGIGAENALTQVNALEPGALEFSNIFSLWRAEPNLTGKNVQIAAICASQTYVNDRPQNDYRFNMNHKSLFDANVRFTDSTDGRLGISQHATAIAGVLLGLDDSARDAAGSAFAYRGACPDASVTVHEFWRFAIFHLYGQHDFEADLVTLSLGEMFETWWTRALESVAAQKDILIIASVGNGSGVMPPEPLYHGAGSNVLGVGVIDSVPEPHGPLDLHRFSHARGVHSSMGPTGDLRCKPDIVAPGSAFVPAYNRKDEYLVVENWSSLSAPIVCGTAALLLDKAAQTDTLHQPMTGGRSLVLKSILMNSARKPAYWHKGQPAAGDDHETPLDLRHGAGILDAEAAYDLLLAGAGKPGLVRTSGWDTRVLEKSDWGYEYAFTVTDPNQLITATLCWNRAFADRYPYRRQMNLDTDLRLELWGVDANDPTREVLLDYSDSVNDNVEHIYMTCDPAFVNYAIRVRFNENSSPAVSQRFAVAWSVGPDRQADDPWWYDLNGDSVIDAADKLAFAMFDEGLAVSMNPAIVQQALNMSADRAALLKDNWPQYKLRLPLYANTATDSVAVSD
jgi:hypothetical protein